MDKKLVMLAIIDGWGINENENANAAKLANTPNLDAIFKQYPNTQIHTSGLDVGLPDGQMGNSEVGHTNIGAGRIVYQDLAKITKSIEDGDFFSVPEFVQAIENCNKLKYLNLSNFSINCQTEDMFLFNKKNCQFITNNKDLLSLYNSS